MKLSQKLRYLRHVEGVLRGHGRDLTQAEVVREIRRTLGRALSQAYLSQLESGARRHMTNPTRLLLARFYKVHPGYLVDDPDGFHTELVSDLVGAREDSLDRWLLAGADRFAETDPEVSRALWAVAGDPDSRAGLALLGAILETPGLAPRLRQVLQPERDNPVTARGKGARLA